MRLLILTQKVDRNDDVLGFFHRWLEVFAEHFDSVIVICLQRGSCDLPSNVTVHSLGKEEGVSRIGYVITFIRYIVRFRGDYDAVFVHMNPEYVILGGLLWQLWGKRVVLWYNHAKGGVRLHIASWFAEYVLYTSPSAASVRFRRARQMPAGIDTAKSEHGSAIQRKERSILSLGRISPVKHIDVIIGALANLSERSISYTASIYGGPTDRDEMYYRRIRNRAEALGIEKDEVVTFYGSVAYTDTAPLYISHDLFVNATPRGSFDKTILEAIHGGAIPVICNDTFDHEFPPELLFRTGNKNDLARVLEHALSLSHAEKEAMRKRLHRNVLQKHSLKQLSSALVEIMGS